MFKVKTLPKDQLCILLGVVL